MSTINLTKDNFEDILNQYDIVLMDFWASWCGPCKSFAPIFEEVSNVFTDIAFAKIDIESEHELAADFNVRSVPQLVVLKQNIVLFSEAGILPKTALEDLVNQALNLDIEQVKSQIEKGDCAD